MAEKITLRKFFDRIKRLPSDRPIKSRAWYLTQKEHWLGWLTSTKSRDAKAVYNRILNEQMLEWLAKAARVPSHLVAKALAAASRTVGQQRKTAAFRKHVSWEVVASALWRQNPDTQRKRRAAARRAVTTRKRRVAGRKAATTRKRRVAGMKAASTRRRRSAGRKAAATRAKRSAKEG
jgi:hypothetical protein